MALSEQEKVTSRILALTLGSVTVLVFTKSVTDPVNVTKLFLLGGLSFAAIGASLSGKGILRFNSYRAAMIIIGLFFFASINSLVGSTAPLSQSVYGVYGRNNGFLLYIFLILIFISTLSLREPISFKYLLSALFFAGCVNIAYALWVMAFGDFVGWNNIYGNLLGTLGNPNFIGSFFGMFSALLFTYLLNPESSWKIRIASFWLLILCLIGIVESHAVQGKVLFVASLGLTLFFTIRNKFQKFWIDITYIVITLIVSVMALLGTLQKGPLAEFLYKETITLRGEYWYAGLRSGIQNPWFGVGFDSYGDWYRRSRRESALILPGVDTVSNTAHNVYLDIFSFGGWPLFVAYTALNLFVLVIIIKATFKTRSFDPIFISLSTVWICYQLQSLISINQIGLAIWGWVFGAAIIAYTSRERTLITETFKSPSNTKVKVRQPQQIISSRLIAGIMAIIGFIVAVPPLSADSKWREAQVSRDASKFEAALQNDYFNPSSSYKFVNIVALFENNQLYELSHKFALKAVQYNPDSYESWRILLNLQQTSAREKKLALQNLKRLDPLNTKIGND